MGLDMYLTRKTYVKNWDHMKPEQKHKITVKLGGKARTDIKPERIEYVIEEVACWRKANAIHKWFVDHVQGGKDECQESYVNREQLQELLDLCKMILANPEKAPTTLPAQSGFFFGSTDYDEWYFQDLEYTIKTIEEIMKEEDYGSLYYSSSW